MPMDLAKSDLEIYGFPAIKRNMAILFSVNLSPFLVAFSINFSINLSVFSINFSAIPSLFSTNFSVTLGTETFKIKSSAWRESGERNNR